MRRVSCSTGAACVFAALWGLAAQAENLAFTPFPPSSAWQPVPEGLAAGRQDDQIVLQSSSGHLQGIKQPHRDAMPAITLRVDEVTGPPGTRAGVSLLADLSNPVGATLLVDREGNIEIEARDWANHQTLRPSAPMAFPFWVHLGYSGGGFGCSISQDRENWETLTTFGITFPPASYQLLLQSGNPVEEACATFAEVSLLGADANDNGITDGWEIENFGRVLGIADSSDPDSDGRSNREEWLDRTDPTVSDLPMTSHFTKHEDRLRLRLSQAIPGLTFEKSRDLANWEIVPYTEFTLSHSFPNDTTTVDFNQGDGERLFYRAVLPAPTDPDPFTLFPKIR